MHKTTLARGLLLTLAICVGGGLPAQTFGAPPAAAIPRSDQARARAKLIRSSLRLHQELRAARIPMPLPQSTVLKPELAQTKTYGDSWTCRESSRFLQRVLNNHNLSLKIDSSGPNAFRWGEEGWVSFHYYLVDNVAQPRLLIDPTASTNFARDAAPTGLLRGLLLQVGQERNLSGAANRVAQRIQRGQPDRALVLANRPEIAVYKEALDRAAQLQSTVSRNVQLLGQ